MARMKTGRLTTKTTTPQKPSVSTKPGVSNVSNQGEWDKYDQDYKAYKNYDNEVKAYNKQMESYKKSKLQGPADYRALDSGSISDRNMRKLESGELAEFNAYQKNNNPDAPDYSWVKVSKDTQRGKWGNFMGDVAKPTAPTKREQPKVPELTGTMNILKPGKIDIKKRIIKAKEKPEPVLFDNPNKAVVGKNKSTHGSEGISYKVKDAKESFKRGDTRDEVSTRNKIGYKKEQRLFKAKASTGAAGADFTNLDSQDIKYARKNYLKKDLAAARTDATLKPDERAKRIASAKMEIKQSRGAQTYSRKMEKGKLSHFNDENYKGDIIKDYKSSLDNVNNKNTIDAKLKAIGEKAKTRPGSFGNMPTS